MSRSGLNPVAALNSFPVNQRIAALQAGMQYLGVYTSADQGVTNSVALVRSNELQVRLPYTPPGAFIFFRAVLHWNIAVAANNVRMQFQGDEGLVLDVNQSRYYSELKINGGGYQIDNALANVALTVLGGAATAWTEQVLEGVFRVTQPGLLAIAFAQNVAAANTVTLMRGSSLNLNLTPG
jgi:hypothetical protein